VREITEPCPAEFFLDCDAEKTELAKQRPQLAGKFVGAVDLVGARGDLVLGKRPDRIAQHVDVAAEAKIEAGKTVLHHGWLPHRRLGGPGLQTNK
jgi:hypothetical protein